MNNYPRWWNSNITVYTKYEDEVTNVISWHRYEISNCFWKYTGNKTTVGNTILESKTIICRIPIQSNFMEKGQWITLPNEQLDNYFTVGPDDIIIRGIVTDTINEYQNGHRSSDLLTKYRKFGECMVVNRFADNTGGGRNEEHYLVQGE